MWRAESKAVKGRNQGVLERLPRKSVKSHLICRERMSGSMSRVVHVHILSNCIFFPTFLDLEASEK